MGGGAVAIPTQRVGYSPENFEHNILPYHENINQNISNLIFTLRHTTVYSNVVSSVLYSTLFNMENVFINSIL